jgi:hypothetical protein
MVRPLDVYADVMTYIMVTFSRDAHLLSMCGDLTLVCACHTYGSVYS